MLLLLFGFVLLFVVVFVEFVIDVVLIVELFSITIVPLTEEPFVVVVFY